LIKRYGFFGKSIGGRPKHDPEPSIAKSKFSQRDQALPFHEAQPFGFALSRARFFIEQSKVSSVWKRKLTPAAVFTHKGLDNKLRVLFSNEKLFASASSQKRGTTVRPLIAKCIIWNLLRQKEASSFGEFSKEVKIKFRQISGADFGLSNQTITSVASVLIKAKIIQ
jgi:hypothetical protein